MAGVFVSYSRKDQEFAVRLREALELNGEQVWLDLSDIRKGDDWWAKIQRGIDSTPNFIIIVSPSSMASQVCNWEIEHALKTGKRLIPVIYRPVCIDNNLDDFVDELKAGLYRKQWDNLANENWAALRRINWLQFQSEADFKEHLDELLQTIQQDPTHMEMHTEILNRAREWEIAGKREGLGLLLNNEKLQKAVAWLEYSKDREPRPTALHYEFVQASSELRARQQRERDQLLQDLDHRSQLLKAVVDVSVAVNSISPTKYAKQDEVDLYQTLVRVIKDRLNLYYVGIFIVDATQKVAKLQAGTGEEGQAMISAQHQLSIDAKSMIGWCILNETARIALDVGEDAVRFNNPHLPETRSEMALPLKARKNMIGALSIQSSLKAAFNEHDISILQAMADQIAIAIDNMTLLRDLAKHSRQFKIVTQIAKMAIEADTIEQLLNAIVENIKQELHLYYVGVFLLDADGEFAVLKAGSGEEGQKMVNMGHQLRADEKSMIGWCISNKTPRIAFDVGEDAVRFNNPHLPETRSEMALPLLYKDKCLGALTIQSRNQIAFSEQDILTVQSTGTQIAMVIEHKFRQNQSLSG